MSESRHVAVVVRRPFDEVYAYAAEPTNLPEWASGLAGAEVQPDGGAWLTQSPMGPVRFTFTPSNDLGVLDHDVTLPTGETQHNPMRVLHHPDGAEVVFTLRRSPGMSDEQLEQDAATIAADLHTLKAVLEQGDRAG